MPTRTQRVRVGKTNKRHEKKFVARKRKRKKEKKIKKAKERERKCVCVCVCVKKGRKEIL